MAMRCRGKRILNAACLIGVSAFAADYTWINSSAGAQDWNTVANWSVNGTTPATPPTNATDTATFNTVPDYLQNAKWGNLSSTASPFAKLTGPLDVLISFSDRDKMLAVEDPSDFSGTFRIDYARTILQAKSTPDKNVRIRNVDNSASVKIENKGSADDGSKLIVDDIFGSGIINLNASYNPMYLSNNKCKGTIEIGKTGGSAQTVSVYQGKAIFNGNDKDAVPGIAGEPWMHLDASVAFSIELTDGKVSKWKDVRNNGVYAGAWTPPWNTKAVNLPTIRQNWANGLNAVDFGEFSGNDGSRLHTSAYSKSQYAFNYNRAGNPSALLWSERRDDIKELFFVFTDTSNTQFFGAVECSSPYIVGDTEKISLPRNNTGRLFFNRTDKDMRALIGGEVRVDGVRVPYDHADNYAYRPHVVSVRGGRDIAASLFGASGEKYLEEGVNRDMRLGGMQLGEVLVYTNSLTDAERASVESYLMAKWNPAEYAKLHKTDIGLIDQDPARLGIAANSHGTFAGNSTIEFENGVFAVENMRFHSGLESFTKKGSATLEVGRVLPLDLSYKIAGGAIEFKQSRVPAPAGTAPANAPTVWLDASDADSFEYAGTDGNKVSTWRDKRTGLSSRPYTVQCNEGQYASRISVTGMPYPVMDYGSTFINGNSDISNPSQEIKNFHKGTLAAFVVYRRTDPAGKNIPFGANGMVGSGNNNFDNSWNSSTHYLSVVWAQNGIAVASQGYNMPESPENFAVYSVIANAPIELQYLCNDRGGKIYGGGGGQIAEVLFYDRRLTLAERIETEAYLMKKWLDKPHPVATRMANIPEMEFSEGVDAIVSTEENLSIGRLVSNSGKFVKKGPGDVAVANAFPATATDVSVENGDIAFAEQMNLYTRAAFHVDASVSGSIVFKEGQENDKRIEKWYDCRGNGLYAATPIAAPDAKNYQGLTNALYCTTADDSEGICANLPYVDFLEYSTGSQNTTNRSSGMLWHKADGTKNVLSDTREVHLVFMMKNEKNESNMNIAPIGGEKGTTVDGLVPDASADGGFWSSCTHANTAAKKTDGSEWFTGNRFHPIAYTSMYNKFYVMSLVATGNISACSFALDRVNCGRGSLKLCEAIIYAGKTNTTEQTEYIHAELLKKWKAVGDGGDYAHKIDSVHVAAGSSLSVNSGLKLGIGKLSGGGNIAIGNEASGIEEISATIDETGNVSCITFAETVSFADTVKVKVDVAREDALEVGTYDIVKAASIGNRNDIEWVLEESADLVNFTLSVTSDSDSVSLRVASRGTLILVK